MKSAREWAQEIEARCAADSSKPRLLVEEQVIAEAMGQSAREVRKAHARRMGLPAPASMNCPVCGARAVGAMGGDGVATSRFCGEGHAW